MTRSRRAWARRCAALALAAWGAAVQAGDPVLYAYSTIDALLAGAYDGERTVGELRARGDFGLGTYNRLDGELLALDGVYYHVRSDGSVSVAAPSDRVPLAYVVPFVQTAGFELKEGAAGSRLADLEALIDERLANKNLFYAVQVSGRFTAVSTRAIGPQSRPYKPLAEVSKSQAVFRREAVRGTMIGFRSPPFSKGVSVPGWHWHFLSEDKAYGGHILAGALAEGRVRIAAIRRFEVDLPDTADFANADQQRDRSRELHEVEGGRQE